MPLGIKKPDQTGLSNTNHRGLWGTVVPKYLAGCKAITTILPQLSTLGSTSCVWYPVCNWQLQQWWLYMITSPIGNSYDEGDDS
ncbi:uncharacterized protein LACBIDRAFT_315234 [Laccaria bicolor S238N-H82]|uniref:Predicted protein n=1 Tax=Laccaria bicolor (strain S238N-H82 / ATCC MYA-4686) TaxID=486041 RepID=B0E049_LACBS|nr:uncharacterized protein LACBIDRAFT_315234 [Laccaria bicolor S238N-H82]EDQ99725.1 predicted protein [Laccaria bicolor S238N-H82]|eukprot:XP_001889561.1 predicted protein [Laccaria bicolor S238N-H82]